MEAHLLAAPAGFPSACLAINELAKTPQRLQSIARASTAASDADPSVSAAVEFILLGAARYGLDAKQLALALARQTDLSQASIVALAAEVKPPAPQGSSAPSTPTVSHGHAFAAAPPQRAPALVHLDWALGVPVLSSTSTAPGRPFVSLSMRVRGEGGELRTETVEMTLPQLKGFEAALREASAALDTA